MRIASLPVFSLRGDGGNYKLNLPASRSGSLETGDDLAAADGKRTDIRRPARPSTKPQVYAGFSSLKATMPSGGTTIVSEQGRP